MCYVLASGRINPTYIPLLSELKEYLGIGHSVFKHECELAGGGHNLYVGSVVDLGGSRKASEPLPLGFLAYLGKDKRDHI